MKSTHEDESITFAEYGPAGSPEMSRVGVPEIASGGPEHPEPANKKEPGPQTPTPVMVNGWLAMGDDGAILTAQAAAAGFTVTRISPKPRRTSNPKRPFLRTPIKPYPEPDSYALKRSRLDTSLGRFQMIEQ